MRSKFFLLGLVLVFSGILITSLYNASSKSYVYQQDYSETDSFQVSGYFTKGEELVFAMVPSNTWLDWIDFLGYTPDYYNGTNYLEATIQVRINNTDGQRTAINLIFFTYATTTGEYAQLSLQSVYTNFTTGGLANIGSASEKQGAFKGVVETSGTYTVEILGPPSDPKILYDEHIPPTSITLNRYVAQESYPYRWTWPIGVALVVSGGFSSFWSRRQTKKQKLVRKKKTG
jgi:hypothetical protein